MARRVKQAGFKFRPFSKKQIQVLTWWMPESGVSDADGIIADGAIRSGKTVSMALAFVIWAMTTFQEQNLGMAGKTVGSFRRNVLGPLKKMLRSRGYKYQDFRSDNMLEVRKGKRVNYFYIFGGKDERSQDFIQGITLAGLLLDEVALMPESFVNQATGRCSVDGSKFWFNCNPGSPAHWFKKNWIEKRAEKNLLYLHFTMDDNLSLAERVKQRYRAMYTGVFFRRYILGEWAMAEGLVYQFDTEKHIAKELPQHGEYHISVDYGTLNPFSAGLWCVNGGRAVRLREYYWSGREKQRLKTDEEYYRELETLAGELYIESVIVDPSAASFIETIRRHGRFSVRKAKNEVLNGIRLTAAMLEAGVIKIGESCENSIREFSLYSWAEQGQEDKVVKEYDHAMDDIRYFCATVMKRNRDARRLIGGRMPDDKEDQSVDD